MSEKIKKENRVFLLGFLLILIVATITFMRPVFKFNKGKTEAPPQTQEVYEYAYITSEELGEKIIKKEKLKIIDIRDAVSYEKEHIEDSVNITPEKIKDEVIKLNKEELIVIVGYDFEDKNAEAGAVKFFKDSGFKNVLALSGGIYAWKTKSNNTVGIGDPESVLDRAKIENILPEQLKLAIDNGYPVTIIDTRSENLFSQGHIPKAMNIPLKDLESKKEDIPLMEEIIVYGDSELLDFQSGVKLYDLGFLATYTIEGGLRAWQEKGFPIEK